MQVEDETLKDIWEGCALPVIKFLCNLRVKLSCQNLPYLWVVFSFRWRGWRGVVCGLCSTDSNKRL